MTLNTEYIWGEPKDFLKNMDERFYNALENNLEYDIIFVVGIKLGSKYIAKRYCLSSAKELYQTSDMIVSKESIQYFYLGEEIHLNYFDDLMHNQPPKDWDDILFKFQETLNYGIQYDDTINNIIEYVQI